MTEQGPIEYVKDSSPKKPRLRNNPFMSRKIYKGNPKMS